MGAVGYALRPHACRRAAAVALSLAAVGGCMTTAPEPYSQKVPYREADFKAFAGKGPVSVHGQTVGGDVKTCAGNAVKLIPDNAYNEEFIAHAGHQPVLDHDPGALAFTRNTLCDAQGKFVFDDVPAGNWYVWTTVVWGVPSESGISKQGGELLQKASLKPGVAEVILTAGDEL
jgi:hypothetical protein